MRKKAHWKEQFLLFLSVAHQRIGQLIFWELNEGIAILFWDD